MVISCKRNTNLMGVEFEFFMDNNFLLIISLEMFVYFIVLPLIQLPNTSTPEVLLQM